MVLGPFGVFLCGECGASQKGEIFDCSCAMIKWTWATIFAAKIGGNLMGECAIPYKANGRRNYEDENALEYARKLQLNVRKAAVVDGDKVSSFTE